MADQSVAPRQREAQQLLDQFGGDRSALRDHVIAKAMRGEAISDVECQLIDPGPAGDYAIELVVHYGDAELPWIVARCELEEGVVAEVTLTLTDTGEVEQESQLTWSGPLARSAVMKRLGHPDFMDQLQDELASPSLLWSAGREWHQPLLDRGRGGRRRGNRDLALWAYRYTRALEVNPRKPTKVLEEWYGELGYKPSHLRKLVATARYRGFLTSTPGPNQPGGELTDQAMKFIHSFPPQELEVPTDVLD